MSLKKRLYQALRILRRRQSSTKAESEKPPPSEVPPSPKPPSPPPSEVPPPDVPSFSDVETISLNPTVQSIQRGVEEVRLQKPKVLDVLLNPEVDYDGLWYAPKVIAPPPHIVNREAPSSLESILAPRKAPSIPSEVKHGTRIYKFVKPIGHGGYGHVYMGHAVDTNDDFKKPQYVAIKVIQKHTLRLTHFDTIGPTSHYGMTTQDILTEVAILKGLNAAKWCPFLIKVLACFQDPENCYFVTRLYPQSLADRLAALRKAHLLMPLEQIRQYGFEMAIALKAIHDQGICHLDIKPDNLMISPLGHLILVDFGCALFRTSHPLTVHTGWRGTPGYASPEARLGQVADSWHKCDTFSCGVVMAEMLMCPTSSMKTDALTSPGHTAYIMIHWRKASFRRS
ncbi:kinase-like protein [Hymenopellis radicata]|nr:kinase-like protein [Hymenopellis radicata]